MEYDKLIRDNIPRIIKDSGKTPITHVASDEEYIKKLKEKLKEEVDEFLKDDNIHEVVDIFEVMMTINNLNGWDLEKLLDFRTKKLKERGGFDKRIILERID